MPDLTEPCLTYDIITFIEVAFPRAPKKCEHIYRKKLLRRTTHPRAVRRIGKSSLSLLQNHNTSSPKIHAFNSNCTNLYSVICEKNLTHLLN